MKQKMINNLEKHILELIELSKEYIDEDKKKILMFAEEINKFLKLIEETEESKIDKINYLNKETKVIIKKIKRLKKELKTEIFKQNKS